MDSLLPILTPRLSRNGRSDTSSRNSDRPDTSESPRKHRLVPKTYTAPQVLEEHAALQESRSNSRLRSPSPSRQSKLREVLQKLESELKRLGLTGSPPSAQSVRLYCDALGQVAELLPSYKSFLAAVRAQSEGYAANLQALASEASKAKSRAKALKARLDKVEAETLLFPSEQNWVLVADLRRQLTMALAGKDQSDARVQKLLRQQARSETAMRQEKQSMQFKLDEARSDRDQMQVALAKAKMDNAKLKKLRTKLENECSQLREQAARSTKSSPSSEGTPSGYRLTSAETDYSRNEQADLSSTIKFDSEVSNSHSPPLGQRQDEQSADEEDDEQSAGAAEPETDYDQRRLPHFWGVTVGQVQKFHDEISADLDSYCKGHMIHCQQGRHVHVCTDSPHDLCNEHTDVERISQEQLSEIERGNLKPLRANMHLVVSRHVKPLTKDKSCSWAALQNPHGLQIQIFITHTWNQEFQAFVHTLLRACDSKDVVWICSLAIPQNAGVKEILSDENIDLSPFAVALKHAERLVVILDADLEVPDRAWCTFEIERAGRWGKPTLIWPHNIDDLPKLQEKIDKVDMAQAQASDEDDLRRIRKSIGESGGFEKLNKRLRNLINDRVRLFLASKGPADSLLQERDKQLQADSEARLQMQMQMEKHLKRIQELEDRLTQSPGLSPEERQNMDRELEELRSEVHEVTLHRDIQHFIEERRKMENQLAAQKHEILQNKMFIQFRQQKTPKLFLQKTLQALQDLAETMIRCGCHQHMKAVFDTEFEDLIDLTLTDMAAYIRDSLGSKLHQLHIVNTIFSRVLKSKSSECDETGLDTSRDDGVDNVRAEIHRLSTSQDLSRILGKLSLLRTSSRLTIASGDDVDVSDLLENALESRRVMDMADEALQDCHGALKECRLRLVQSNWSRGVAVARLERLQAEKLLAEQKYEEFQEQTNSQKKQMEEDYKQSEEERRELRHQLSLAKGLSSHQLPAHGLDDEAMHDLEASWQNRLTEEAKRVKNLDKENLELKEKVRNLEADKKRLKSEHVLMGVSHKLALRNIETLRATRPGLENFMPAEAMRRLLGALYSTSLDELMPPWPQKIKQKIQQELDKVPIDLLGNLHAFYSSAVRKESSREVAKALDLFLPDELVNPDRNYEAPEHELTLQERTSPFDHGVDNEN